jgi:hypothetical protein
MASGKNAGVAREIAGAAAQGSYPTLQVADGAHVATTLSGLTETLAISNVTELQAMKDTLDGNYYLTQDIDASATSGWNGGLGFEPVGAYGGASDDEFAGTFDGNGYKITGLYINRPATSNTGLFGYVFPWNAAEVKIANVTLEDCDISGVEVGALAGFVASGQGVQDKYAITIQNCHVTGTSTVAGVSATVSGLGGLIGIITGDSTAVVTVNDCTTNATVDGSNDHTDTGPQYVGGFVGQIDSSGAGILIDNCRATGDVTCNGVGNDNGELCGGFFGYWEEEGTIQDCATTGSVTGDDEVGGFGGEAAVGCTIVRCSARGDVTSVESGSASGGFLSTFNGTGGSTATLTDCYAWGDVTTPGNGFAGGLIATATGLDSITNCYDVGALTGQYIGGFIQFTGSSGVYIPTLTACFWDTETTGTETGIQFDGAPLITAPTGYNTETMKTQSTYTDASWDFDTVWEMTEAFVSADITTTKLTFTEPFPYEIETGDRYCVSGVPFKARCWPLQEKGVSRFNRWNMVGGALKCRKLSGFDSNDNSYWRVSAYRGAKSEPEAVDVYIPVDQNPADSAGALNVDGVDLEPYIEQIAAGVTFELTNAEFNVTWTDSRKVE